MKVSAIVSAYYAEKYILDRLENLIEQEPQPEIVVICQGDSSELALSAEFLRDHPNLPGFKIVTTPDIPTIYAAWNLGVESASGVYLTNANCDDRLYPGALGKLANVLDEYPQFAAAYFNIDQMKEIGGEPVGRFEWAEGDLSVLLQGCFLGPMPMWRKSLHEEYGPFDPEMQSAGDYEFWLRLAAAGERFFHLRETLGSYLIREDSAERRSEVRAVWETARARARYRSMKGMTNAKSKNATRRTRQL